MGQKVHPTGIRLGIVKDWASKWYADSKAFPGYVAADHEIRVYIKRKLKDMGYTLVDPMEWYLDELPKYEKE